MNATHQKEDCREIETTGIYRLAGTPNNGADYHSVIKCSCGTYHVDLDTDRPLRPKSGHGYASLASAERRIQDEAKKMAKVRIKQYEQAIKVEKLILSNLVAKPISAFNTLAKPVKISMGGIL